MNSNTVADAAASIPHSDSTYTQKPNTIDDIPYTAYDKPNEYDVDEHRQPLPQEVLEDLIVRPQFINGKRPDIKTNDEDEETDQQSQQQQHHSKIPTLLTQKPAIALTGITIQSVDDNSSAIDSNSGSTSISSVSNNCDPTPAHRNSMTTKMALLQILSKDPMEELLSYDLRKTSLSRPFDHDIYFHSTKVLAFKKIQPHSYSWGFQNVLYRASLGSTTLSNDNTAAIKIAEARRRAFKKEITIEWGDYPASSSNSTEAAAPFLEHSDSMNDPGTATTLTHSNQLQNRTKSHLLFVYDTEFEGYRIRWKRIALLSHDLICEIKPSDDNSVLTSHTKGNKVNSSSLSDSKREWRVIAEFDSHRMGYLVFLGKLTIDKNALKLVKRPDHLEAHIIITCCTLIDLMREVVEKAVGLNKGGVVGSE